MLHYEVRKIHFLFFMHLIVTILLGHKHFKSCPKFQFPPYATNETGKVAGLNRRELGHGVYKIHVSI